MKRVEQLVGAPLEDLIWEMGVEGASRSLGVSVETVERWRKDPVHVDYC